MKKFTWEEPIEERILEFVNHMRADMDSLVSSRTGFLDRGLRKEAGCFSKAYQTVEDFIIKEIRLRNEI